MTLTEFLPALKQSLGVLFPLIMLAITGIAVLTVSRLLLCLWKKEQVNNSQGWKPIFLSGLRMDVVSMSYLIILPALLTPSIGWGSLSRRRVVSRFKSVDHSQYLVTGLYGSGNTIFY